MFINEVIGDDITEKDYSRLYHLCDHHGFSHTIDSNTLSGYSHAISTTWDETMNYVVGKSHYDFKFVLETKKLLKNYKAYRYDDHGYDGKKYTSHQEREVRIGAKSISNFNRYLIGTVLMFDLYSEKGAQWLLYRNRGQKHQFMAREKTASPQAIYIIDKHINEWNKPIWKGKVGNSFTSDELEYLSYVKKIADMNLPFSEGLKKVTEKYILTDHKGKKIDDQIVARRNMSPKFVDLLNSYYKDKKYHEIDISKVKHIIESIVKMMNYGDNFNTVVLSALEESGLYHPVIEPVSWGSIITEIIDGDMDEIIDVISFISRREKSKIEAYDSGDSAIRKYGVHSSTFFGRGPSANM